MQTLPFDYRRVLQTMNENSVNYLLIGGLNYFLVHKPVTTQDIDLLIEDTPENRSACEQALVELDAEWGKSDDDWGPVKAKSKGWLEAQSVYCLLTPFGPVDVFRSVPGIPGFSDAMFRGINYEIDAGLTVKLICARDLLKCQLALPEKYRKAERIDFLRGVLGNEQ
jgi:hypothetical protein